MFSDGGKAGVEIHRSRLILFFGNELPCSDINAGINRGWADSVLNSIFDAVKNADATTNNIASLIFEAKVDVIKIPEFMANLDDPVYEQAITNRVMLASRAKGINGTLLLDAEEDYQQKSASFGSLKDIMMAMLQVVSGASEIPMARLLGQSASGLAATGDNDVRNYYDFVSGIQELKYTPSLAAFDRLLVTNALGSYPAEGATYEWRTLWQSTDKEKAEVANSLADTIEKLHRTQLFGQDELAESAAARLKEHGVLQSLDTGEYVPEDEQDNETEV